MREQTNALLQLLAELQPDEITEEMIAQLRTMLELERRKQ